MLDFGIFKVLVFRQCRCITLPNVIKINQTAAEISHLTFFSKWRLSAILDFFSPLGKLAGRASYILPVFSLFFIYFVNGRLSNTCISDVNAPIFNKILRLLDGCKGLLTSLSFLDYSSDVAMAPIKVEKSEFFPDQSTLSHCHSETDCNIAIPISKGSIE